MKNINTRLNIRALERHRSRLGWRSAPKYSNYWRECKNSFAEDFKPQLLGFEYQQAELKEEGITSFVTESTQELAEKILDKIRNLENHGSEIWVNQGNTRSAHQTYRGDCWLDFPEIELFFRNDIGNFLRGFFECDFKIFYTSMFKSQGFEDDKAIGSQLWHSDGGPGSCIIVGIYLNETSQNSGCLEAINWQNSMSIFREEKDSLNILTQKYLKQNSKTKKSLSREQRREILCNFYEDEIQNFYKNAIKKPFGKPGLVVPFSNNNIHRGGFPSPGHERYIILTHVYPSKGPTPFSRYREFGLKKTQGYPLDPDF